QKIRQLRRSCSGATGFRTLKRCINEEYDLASNLSSMSLVYNTCTRLTLVDVSRFNHFFPVNDNGTVFQLIEGMFYKEIHRAPVVNDLKKVVNIVSQVTHYHTTLSLLVRCDTTVG